MEIVSFENIYHEYAYHRNYNILLPSISQECVGQQSNALGGAERQIEMNS